ncbi:MAG: L-2-amino-thiazoline-4-carboxylic acid hydrolase [Lachnospiraceae bacterium]|nr:L-2-amino-thiazoline-4-carboxylic acid hydrolase [Lachnospiraceae bacterium]
MAVYEIPETSDRWIRLKLAQEYSSEEAEKKYTEICELYERFAEESPDIGGKDNPMSHNFYGALSTFAYYEGTGRCMTPEEITDMCFGMMMADKGDKRPLEKIDLNNPFIRGFIHMMFGMRARKLNKHKADGSWGNTWGMEINPGKHKKGISMHLVGCPIADFAKAHGYSELMPYFCETDRQVMEAFGGTLYREHMVADGYEDCDYWIRNKGE